MCGPAPDRCVDVGGSSVSPPPVSVPQAAAGPSGEGLVEELRSGPHRGSEAAARSGARPRPEEGEDQTNQSESRDSVSLVEMTDNHTD